MHAGAPTVSKANAQRRLGILPRVARASVLLRGHTQTILYSTRTERYIWQTRRATTSKTACR